MPNKKLPQKLAKKLQKITNLAQSNPQPFNHGIAAFTSIGGNYGKTINPFENFTQSHREFRDGFKTQRKLALHQFTAVPAQQA